MTNNTEQHTVHWKGEPRPDLDAAILEDLYSTGFDKDQDPNDLIFHTYQLTNDEAGPSVFMWGKEGKLWAEYLPETKWVSLAEEPTQ